MWAPHAKAMSVVGDFNEWDYEQHKMLQVTEEGIWSLFIPHIEEGEIYKYAIETLAGDVILKADPYAVYAEVRPNTASVVFDIKGYEWNDKTGIVRKEKSIYKEAMTVYELHFGSWKRKKMERCTLTGKWLKSSSRMWWNINLHILKLCRLLSIHMIVLGDTKERDIMQRRVDLVRRMI